MLAKTAGVKHLIVVINKMDDPTVGWSQERCVSSAQFVPPFQQSLSLFAHHHNSFNECKDALTPFLKLVGFKVAEGEIVHR